jgi:hypothetical protein
MKKLLVALLATAFVGMAFAEAEKKEVCHDKVDKAGKPVMKDGKAVQECKVIKVHKKLEGAEVVPDKKK